ncbi:TlpA family protein disulfide reductase [Mariniflexile sp. HMF6888]|uniref:TlpA family protein disulfide reductase n=1 Tax=Mariniflexile sp. HMF6888 TaxID=3373086 RepID=UPI003791A38D
MNYKILFILMFTSLSVMSQELDLDATLEALRNEKNQKELNQNIRRLENGTAEDLFILIEYYNKDDDKKNAIIKRLNKKYPQSTQASMARMMSFLDVKGGPEEIEAHFKSLHNEYPDVNTDSEKNLVAMAYAEVPNGTKVMEYINSMEDQVYRVAAITMNIDLMEPIDFDQALDIATKEIEGAKKLKENTALSNLLKVDPKSVYNDYINMYGKLLFKAGKNEKAYMYTKEAYDNIEDKDRTLVENYAFLSSIFDKNYEETLPILSEMIKDGKIEKRYVDQVRMAYKTLYPNKDVNTYIGSLQNGFISKIRDQVKPLLINEPAPNFYVTDVNGKKATLADFKGKTIVLDFWATWCGPCVASFPAMQMAVDRYANDANVKFLFIHTWENVADPLTDAKNFLSKRNYTFDLYMDTKDPVTKVPPAVTAFGVNGIPAKFIIDGEGKIRFKLEGFEGKDEVVAEELSQMIELARKGA